MTSVPNPNGIDFHVFEKVRTRLLSERAAAVEDDTVNRPSHYAEGWSNGAEVIDITENLNFCLGNAIKYAARAGKKNPDKYVEDLRKAVWYLEREIARVTQTTSR